MPPNSELDATPKVLITDLDNTLWDWVDAWYRSFSAMLAKVSQLSGVPADVLESEMRQVHQNRGTSEYSFLLDEVPSLIAAAGGVLPSDAYDEAVRALHSARKRHTKLYPEVAQTLKLLKASGVQVIAYTESLAYWTQWRIQKTGLDGLIDTLYSLPDHDWPLGLDAESVRRRPPSEYKLKQTDHRFVPKGSSKPNAEILQSILDGADCSPEDAVYVGDSLMKDVAMAQEVGTIDAHALYGVADSRSEYKLLARVTHWTEETVLREAAIRRRPHVTATHVLDRGFAQVLPLFGIEDPYEA
jgi:phosphoglycolate phosphatase